MTVFAAVSLAICILAAGAAEALQLPAASETRAQAPATVSGSANPVGANVSPLIVPGGPAPRLVASFPKDGARIAAGVTVVSLTFDQPMSDQASALAPDTASTKEALAPNCLAKPRLLTDGKTYVLLCSTEPGKAYVLDTSAKPGFISAADRPSGPAQLHFATTDVIVDNISDALDGAGLSADDVPIMTPQEVNGPRPSPPPVAAPDPTKALLDSTRPHS
jgi:hypothetical protein